MRINNFTLNELFAYCKDVEVRTALSNLAITNNILMSLEKLQGLRDWLKVPIKINSGYRDTAHNERVGGSKSSHHMRGSAFDIQLNFRCEDLFLWVQTHKSEVYQLIVYDDFVHIDFCITGEKPSSAAFIDKRSKMAR